MDPILNVEHLSVDLGGRPIVQDLSFQVEPGETVMMIGPNGAGKTTLFRALMGFIPCRGVVAWKPGTQLGYVPQGVDVNREFPLAVRELFHLGKRRVAEPDVAQALALVNAASLSHRALSNLSSGEFQRVLIAFALAEKPDALLFDEPTSDIDVGGQETIYHRLEHIAREQGLTLLMISHDLNVVLRFATKVLCLNQGFKCLGKPMDILTPDLLRQLYGDEVGFYRHTHGSRPDPNPSSRL
jgi:zinc transport system ATP-binding protein